jgi:hypothetical protein
MACSHSTGCPLFPKLNASLRGWRDAYCDSDTGWQSCARYSQSLTGKSVPITLLPNGKYAHTMARAGDAVATVQRSRFELLPRPVVAADGYPFEEAPQQAPARVAPSVWDAPTPKATPTPSPASTLPRTTAVDSPVLVRTTAAAPPRKPPTPPTADRAGWWTRLVEWMRGPA